jgi:hypothetical protein
MSSLAFLGHASPYSSLYSESEWNLLLNKAAEEYSRIIKLPFTSNLSKIVEVSCLAIQKLSQMDCKQIGGNELPFEIELNPKFIYHSIFYCPVMKEISMGDNNPVLLGCGHMISKYMLN